MNKVRNEGGESLDLVPKGIIHGSNKDAVLAICILSFCCFAVCGLPFVLVLHSTRDHMQQRGIGQRVPMVNLLFYKLNPQAMPPVFPPD